MPVIKFDRRYRKLRALGYPELCSLLMVVKIDGKDITDAFRYYDCSAIENEDDYVIKNEKLMLLILSCKKGLFTTIRDFDPMKYEHYKSWVGCPFVIEYPWKT